MHSNHLTRLLVGGTTLALLNAALSVSISALPVAARQLVAVNGNQPRAPKTAHTDNKNTDRKSGSGTLLALTSSGQTVGQCPLKHTDVQTEISGYIARVTVKQTFNNPFKDKIEAVYTFPLSENGAVDEMTMKVGSRVIKGNIKKRDEARAIYEAAKASGHVASLLDQERTNIFTQSVANIEPGKDIEITIKYIETLPYESGKFTYTFPTVVGPRFNPGEPVGKSGGGWSNDTTKVPDASRITPPVVAEGQRAGHDISINVHLNAGMPISQVSSKLHEVTINNSGSGKADISLADRATIPNKDFVLSWNVAEDKLKSGYVAYRDPAAKDGAGYFTVMLIPPKRVTPDKIAPKEMIFVIDCSGSQSGAPLDKCKETMRYILDHMNANDTFQIIAFSNTQSTFADKPQPVSAEMRAKARQFIDSLQANGGTWMAPAVEKACAIPADSHRLRVVTFMTDGYVGNDYEVLGMVKKLRGKSRWFAFGTGNSVNRTLIDGIAREGGGEPEYVLLNSSAEAAGKKFYDRISTPVLTDVELHTDGVTTKEVYPKEVSDVWAEKPLYFKGKYFKGGAGTITLKGFAGGKPYEQKLDVKFPESDTKNRGVASMWARAKVDRLMSEDWFGAQSGQPNKEIKDEITNVALDHHILTQYTSFVAVDEAVTKGSAGKTVNVEVEMPDGVSREGVFGARSDKKVAMNQAKGRFMFAPGSSRGSMFSSFGGSFGAAGGGGMAMPAASPAPYPSQPVSRAKPSRLESASFYKASRQLQVADSSSSPMVSNELAAKDEESDKKNSPREASKAKEQDRDDRRKENRPKFDNISELKSATASSKLSQQLAMLVNKTGTVTNVKRIGDRYMVTIKVKNLDVKIEKLLKSLGLTITAKKDGSVEGFIALDKVNKLAANDFVLHIDLVSDRK
jgi:Ca-activated chloride channel family protein